MNSSLPVTQATVVMARNQHRPLRPLEETTLLITPSFEEDQKPTSEVGVDIVIAVITAIAREGHHRCVCVRVCVCVCPSLSVYLSIYLSIYLIYLSIYLSIYLIYLSIYLSYLSIYLIYLSYLSIYRLLLIVRSLFCPRFFYFVFVYPSSVAFFSNSFLLLLCLSPFPSLSLSFSFLLGNACWWNRRKSTGWEQWGDREWKYKS